MIYTRPRVPWSKGKIKNFYLEERVDTMDFGFNDEYKMIQKMYRDFAEKEIKPLAEEIDENERFPKESVQKMADNGMLGIPWPEEYGGE